MKIQTEPRSPNFSSDPIRVDYVVIHYTGTTLARTLEIFSDPTRKVSAHLVIDRDGTVYELVPCLDGVAYGAWHAGKSELGEGEIRVERFNERSVGIELVNLNGNVFHYTDAQYAALAECLGVLREKYPAVGQKGRIVGHEDVAGFRGKCDPGIRFDWERIGGRGTEPKSGSVCSNSFAVQLGRVYQALAPASFKGNPEGGLTYETLQSGVPGEVFEELSSLCEQVCASRC